MVLQQVISRFTELGMQPVIGPELEFFLLQPDPQAPSGWRRYGEATGNVYVAGRKGDPDNLLIGMLRQLSEYGLDVVAANHEFASGQFEINLWHGPALDAADRAFRFRSAVKELARQQDKLATFMAKPFNDEGGSGFHLHFSTVDDDDRSLFEIRKDVSVSRTRPDRRWPASWPTPPRWRRWPTRRSTRTNGSARTPGPWLIDWGWTAAR